MYLSDELSIVLLNRRLIRGASVSDSMQEVIEADDWLLVLAVGTTTPFESPQPLVQAVGTTTFALVDVTVTDASALDRDDRLYVGPGAWDRVIGIERRLTYHELTPAVKAVLATTVEQIIRRNDRRFIEAFNTTIFEDRDGHPLDLLPGLSADCQGAIVAERSQRRFADAADLTARVACCEQPWDLLVERVLLELRSGEDTYRWLTA
jgi:putative nucleotide binding protein